MMKTLEKCKNCGQARRVLPSRLRLATYTGLCNTCYRYGRRGSNNPNWTGGRQETSMGYILVYLSPIDFFSPMAQKSGYVLEHRLVMARHLNRCLLCWEVVHHKNSNPQDNRLENLELLTVKRHMPSMQLSRYIKQRIDEAYQRGLVDGRKEAINE